MRAAWQRLSATSALAATAGPRFCCWEWCWARWKRAPPRMGGVAARTTFRPTPGAVEYLHFLAANGYSLAPIEQVIIGERDAEQVYQEATAVTT